MDFKELSQKIVDAPIGQSRLTDMNKGTYSLVISADGKSIALVSDKKKKTPITVNSLAAMRVVADAATAATVETTRDARTSDAYSPLQELLASERVKVSESTKFNVVHKLRILDTITGKPIFRNEHYTGYPAYVKASREASQLPGDTDAQKAAKNAAYTAASEVLHATEVKTGTAIEEKNLIMMPVFTVTN